MNVNQFMESARVQAADITAAELLQMRERTFTGFCEVEKGQGGLDLTAPLSHPQGQENFRVLFARTLEELTEAADAGDLTHFQEELIDAINFGTSVMFLEGIRPETRLELADMIELSLGEAGSSSHGGPLFELKASLETHTFERVLKPWGEALEKLRNRAWQNSVQSPYFLGDNQALRAVYELWMFTLDFFETHEDFITMYIAKDMVLQHRLSSNY